MSPPSPDPLAVALEYDGHGAPRVTAKGRGELAQRIIETAREHDVDIERNAVLAQALSTVEL
ncbi:EscU/YscU/HrcU family type III secretion system export apparatus switch protein, partial [Cupriavidus sp. 2MCAB6]|uniref:EscU/YscU/HrcU family type III secretion system export apparatus switch protein n=1 Tax=Cupriavidus sp. 2MCAB6 TaxID=3232981 RepID=UPI003F900A53